MTDIRVTVTPAAVTTDADVTVTAVTPATVTHHPATVATDGVTVIDHTDVRRDWRHHATTATAVLFVADSAAAVYLSALHIHPQAAWTLTALSPALALALTVLTHHTRQAGRRLTLTQPR